MLFCHRSSKKEHDEVAAKKALSTPPAPSAIPVPPLPPPQLETPKSSAVLHGGPSTPSDLGTPKSTSSLESCHGHGHPQKELTMPTLADCPPNASKEELSKWKQKQSEFWQYKKLSGPDADDYRH